MSAELETLLLKTLSFYYDMSLEEILLSISEEDAVNQGQLTIDALKEKLKELKKKGLLKEIKKEGHSLWIRTLPKKKWWMRIFGYWR